MSARSLTDALGGRWHGSYGAARCPAHDDRDPSLTIRDGDDSVLLTCHAGCDRVAIIAALKARGQWTEKESESSKRERRMVAAYDYRDETGRLVFQAVRFEPKGFAQRRPGQGGGWTWNLEGVRLVPYRLPELLARPEGAPVYIVEGEKDADRLASLGLVATCNPMGAGKWRAEYAEYLRGTESIIIPDNDDTGRKHAEDVRRSLTGVAGRVRTLMLPDKDVSEWLDRGHPLEELVGLAAVAPNGTSTPPPIPYVLFADTRPVLSNQWLIKGVLPKNGTAVIYGPSGEGKTFVALDLLLHVGRGAFWRGRKTARAGILYLSPDGGSVVANRLEAYRRHYGVADADFVIVSSPVDLLGKVSAGDLVKVEELIAHVELTHGIRISVIVVDTVSRAMPGGDENQPSDMSRFVDNLGRLAGDDERLIIGVHHTPKSDGTVLRGHSSLHGAADCELNVVEQTIRVAKQRDGEDGLRFGFQLEVVQIGHDEDGDPVTSCVAVASDVPNSAPKRITGAAQIALRLLFDAVIGAGEVPPACNHIPPNTRAVRMELWRRYCDHGQVSDCDTPDAKRKAFKRAAARLQELGAIGVWGDWVWPADNRT